VKQRVHDTRAKDMWTNTEKSAAVCNIKRFAQITQWESNCPVYFKSFHWVIRILSEIHHVYVCFLSSHIQYVFHTVRLLCAMTLEESMIFLLSTVLKPHTHTHTHTHTLCMYIMVLYSKNSIFSPQTLTRPLNLPITHTHTHTMSTVEMSQS